MNPNYLGITNISTLESVLTYLESIDDPSSVAVFLDWDDTLVNPDYDSIVEPEITKELFDYMVKHKIYFSIITGRFYTTVCDDNNRNLSVMQHNIKTTMYPSLNKLGIDTSKYLSSDFTENPYKIYDKYNNCVGILYMGIFFSGNKGVTIKNFLRQSGITDQKKQIIFVDDYEPYLYEVSNSLPKVKSFRRLVNYVPLN